MVDKIYDIKNQIVEQVERNLRENGADRIDGEMVDMIKDLANAEKACWEAEYYRSVVDAMENDSSGYDGRSRGGNSGNSGYRWANQYGSGRKGYNQSGSQGGQSRGMGYEEALNTMRGYMHNSDPVERERIRKDMTSMMEQSR